MRWLVVAAMVVCTGCAPSWKHGPHDQLYQRTPAPRLHRMPAPSVSGDWWDRTLHAAVLPLARRLSPAQYLQGLTGGRPALDINAFGKVPDSTWFENRLGRYKLTVDQVRRGPNSLGGPADGPLVVISGKLEGVTPGVVVRDSAQVVWFIKFDPPAFSQMASGAEAIASRLLWAAGYHVPETYIHNFDVSQLVIGPEARTVDRYGRSVRLGEPQLAALLPQVNLRPDGKVRALFSRAVPGRPLGPFDFRGVRSDDPNDRLPHERRRSLRGLWLFCAWINNTDTRRQNTMDTFIVQDEVQGLGFVRHYLLDFGDALGSSGDREKLPQEGYEGFVDWSEIGKRAIAAGLYYPYWLGVRRSPYRAVGIFESEVFDPARWRPEFSNPAFEEATARDTFWAASILARFTPELVAAAVSVGELSELGATEWVTRVLLVRRDKLLVYAFEHMSALDDPQVREGTRVELIDLEVLAGLLRGTVQYRWRLRWDRTRGDDRELGHLVTTAPSVDLRKLAPSLWNSPPAGLSADPFVTLTVQRIDQSAAVHVHLRVVGQRVLVVGLARDVD